MKRLHERLCFELSRPDGGVREFIITAQGWTEAFALVDAIVARSPTIAGWKFLALKPPMGFDFKTTYEGICFDPKLMWFRPLQSNSDPQDLGLRVGVPNFSSEIQRQAENAVFVILDTALGERAAAVDIQYVEVAVLPEDPGAKGYIELFRLPEYIDYLKEKLRMSR